MTGRLYAFTPSGERCCVARVMVGAEGGRWIRIEFASAYSADYSYSGYNSLEDAIEHARVIWRGHIRAIGLLQPEIDWTAREPLTVDERAVITRAVRANAWQRVRELEVAI